MKVFVLASIFFLLFFNFSIIAEAKTIEVGENSTCQTVQEALSIAEEGDLINVHSGIYSIDRSIYLKSGIEISGATDGQTIFYTDSFQDINSEEQPALFYCKGIENVYIHDIIFRGAARTLQHQHENGGTSSIGGLREARNGIKIEDSKNIDIKNCRFELLLSDGIRITNSNNINIENCIIKCAGHDSVSIFKSDNVTIQNCILDLMINTCIRVYDSTNCQVYKNTFQQSIEGTGAGYIEFEGSIKNIDVQNNLFKTSEDPIIFTANPTGGDAQIINNALYNAPELLSSYKPYSVILENNTRFDTSQNFADMGYGYNASYEGVTIPYEGIPAKEEYNMSDIIIENETCYNTSSNNTEFTIDQTSTAILLLQEGKRDLEKSNNLSVNDPIREKYIQSGNYKIKCAQSLLNMSVDM